MRLGWLLITAAWLVFLHHYQKHGYWWDRHDLRTLKFRSHEFWWATLLTAGLVTLAL